MEINKKTLNLNHRPNGPTDTPSNKSRIHFSGTQETFSCVEYTMDHKVSFSKLNIKIKPNILTDQVEWNKKWTRRKLDSLQYVEWKNTFLNNQWVKEEIRMEIKIYPNTLQFYMDWLLSFYIAIFMPFFNPEHWNALFCANEIGHLSFTKNINILFILINYCINVNQITSFLKCWIIGKMKLQLQWDNTSHPPGWLKDR